MSRSRLYVPYFSFKEELYSEFLNLIKGDRNSYTSPDRHNYIPFQIRDLWRHYGVPAEIVKFDHHGYVGKNIWVSPPRPGPFQLLFAHHDTVPNCPGIDDNGSGMVIVYLLAIWYHQHKEQINPNIAFAMTDYEEGDPRAFKLFEEYTREINQNAIWADLATNYEVASDFIKYRNGKMKEYTSFLGARKLLEFLKKSDLINDIEIAIDYETVGYTSKEQKRIPNSPIHRDTGDFLGIAINNESEKWQQRINNLNHDLPILVLPVPQKGHPIPDTRRSDHSVFWDDDIDAMILTDTANYRNPNYHLASDLEIDKDFIEQVCDFSVALFMKKQIE